MGLAIGIAFAASPVGCNMKNVIKQIEEPDYDGLIAQLRDRQLSLALAGRLRESHEVAERIKRVRLARRRLRRGAGQLVGR